MSYNTLLPKRSFISPHSQVKELSSSKSYWAFIDSRTGEAFVHEISFSNPSYVAHKLFWGVAPLRLWSSPRMGHCKSAKFYEREDGRRVSVPTRFATFNRRNSLNGISYDIQPL
jgi:hypothetical protein